MGWLRVVQAKFKRRLVGGGHDADAFLRAVAAELDRWADPESNRVKKGRRPQYVLFTTNVVLSAVPRSGGIDRAEALIEGYADRLGLKGWRVWHHDQLCCATSVLLSWRIALPASLARSQDTA